MKRLFLYIAFLATALTFTACSGSDDDNGDPKPGQKYRRSLIIYMAAQNSLGDAGASRLDLNEITQGVTVANSTKDNVFVFLDDDQVPRLYRIYRYKNRTITDEVFTWKTDICSTDPATLCEVLKWVNTNYASESYGLVLWSHGNGWLPASKTQSTLKSKTYSFGIDVGPDGNMATDKDKTGSTGPQMNISDIAKAISASNTHMDYIFFDACLMQNIEVAYELKDVTNYVVGCAISTSAYGGYYTALIPKGLLAYPANDDNVSRIASQYYYDCTENPNTPKASRDYGCVVSVLKTEQLAQFATLTGTMVYKILKNRITPDMGGIQAYCTSELYDSPDFYDMGSTMFALLSKQDYETWDTLARKVVISHHISDKFFLARVKTDPIIYGYNTDPDHALGVSMFVNDKKFSGFIYSNFNKDFQQTRWYRDTNWASTGW